MKRFFFLTFIFWGLTALSQNFSPSAINIPNQTLNLYNIGTLGYDILDVGQRKDDSTYLPGVMFQYRTDIISTDILKVKFPNLKIDKESIKLFLPELIAYKDTFIVLWYIRDYLWNQYSIINAMLVCSKKDGSIDYFVDYNNDRSFNDKPQALDFAGQPYKRIEIKTNLNHLYVVNLINPNSGERIVNSKRNLSQIENRMKINEAWEFSRNKPSINIYLSVSSCPGKVREEFEPMIKAENTKYLAYSGRIETSISIDLSASVSYKGFSIGGIFSSEKNHFSSQYITEYYVNPIEVIKKNELIKLTERSTTGINWPEIRNSIGTFVGYDFQFNDWAISPSLEIGTFRFKSKLNFETGNQLKYQDYIKNPIYYKYGVDIKYLVNQNIRFLIRTHLKTSEYDNSEFYNIHYLTSGGIVSSSYEQKYRQLYIGLGLQFRL